MNKIQKEKLVKSLYEKYPYPSRKITTKEELKYFAKWAARIIKKDESFWKGKKILELGCGTGELANALALFGAKVTAIDFSSTSIKKARKLAKQLGNGKKITFLEKNILHLEEKELGGFDVVIALGSLHHTINAHEAFKIACQQLRKNGIVIVGLYNKYSRARHRIKRLIIKILAGNDFEKRILFGEKIFGTNGDKSWAADKYGQVHETYHSINEILKWFDEQEITFISSKPFFSKPVIDEIKWLLNKENAFFVMAGQK
jgi:2-polyprenyl-3-methyl-5-hydroxy-6-metoxy-1,4-benzoquinol methylase